MSTSEEKRFINRIKYQTGLNQSQLAERLGFGKSYLSDIMAGRKPLTDSIRTKMEALAGELCTQTENEDEIAQVSNGTILVIPTGARAGTLADFCQSVTEWDCERIVSPVRGADFAMQVTGDSMSPEYPNGCQIIVKRIDEDAFVEWGKVYVLDTDNGPVIKQVRRTDDPQVVECVSLNPAYQSFTVPTRYIHGWYRVVLVMALK